MKNSAEETSRLQSLLQMKALHLNLNMGFEEIHRQINKDLNKCPLQFNSFEVLFWIHTIHHIDIFLFLLQKHWGSVASPINQYRWYSITSTSSNMISPLSWSRDNVLSDSFNRSSCIWHLANGNKLWSPLVVFTSLNKSYVPANIY